MKVIVEFFGVARQFAMVEKCQLELDEGANLRSAVAELAHRFPRLAEEKLIQDERELAPSFALSINGRMVARDVDAGLSDDDHLLLVSAVWGG